MLAFLTLQFTLFLIALDMMTLLWKQNEHHVLITSHWSFFITKQVIYGYFPHSVNITFNAKYALYQENENILDVEIIEYAIAIFVQCEICFTKLLNLKPMITNH